MRTLRPAPFLCLSLLLFFWTLTAVRADEETLARINGAGGELDPTGNMTPGVLQLDSPSAFALVKDSKERIAAAAAPVGEGRAVAFSHGSFIKQTSSGEAPRLTAWMKTLLGWLAQSPTGTIGLQDSSVLTSVSASLREMGFEVEVFSPALLEEREVQAYCVLGQDANLTEPDFEALDNFLGNGGGVMVLATPWAFQKKFPDFKSTFPGNRILQAGGIEFLPRGYAGARPFTLVASSLDPSQLPVPSSPQPTEEPASGDLAELLERTYPMPEFKPLLELVDQWRNVPERAFPDQVHVKVPLEYRRSGEERQVAKAGHAAKPLKFKPGSLLVGIQEWRAVVPVEDTNFQEAVTERYEAGLKEARARVLAQREEMRQEVAALAAMEETQPPLSPVTRTPLTSTVAASYGKEFRGDYMPEIANGKNLPSHHEIALGPLGGKAAVPYGKKEARIVELWENGPGSKAGLQQGDILVKVNNEPFKTYGSKSADGPTGAPEQLGLAMIESQAAGRALDLTVRRDGAEEKLRIELPSLPAFSETYPENCERSQALVEASAQWLADNQNDVGLWRSNDYSCAWCGLALLATGDAKYARLLRKTARAFAEEYAFPKEPTNADLIRAGKDARNNWKVSMVGIFLGEYYLATGDDQVLDALMHCAQRMEARLHPKNGRLGHSENNLPYSEKGLVIVNTHAHILWALSAQANGMEWDWTPWDLSYQAIDASIGKDNGVGYNFSARGGSQSGSRTGSMVTAQFLADRDTAAARKLSSWLKDNYHHFPNTHAMTSLGLIFGVMGLKNSNPSAYRKCMDDYRWMFSLVQPANLDHGSYYYGQRKNHGGDGYCNRRFVGNYTTVMLLASHRDDTLWMFGNRERNWYR